MHFADFKMAEQCAVNNGIARTHNRNKMHATVGVVKRKKINFIIGDTMHTQNICIKNVEHSLY